MSEVETLVRGTLAARARTVPDHGYAASPALVADVAARVGRLRRRRLVGGTAAASGVVLAAVALASAWLGTPSARPLVPFGGGSITIATPADPAQAQREADAAAQSAAASAAAAASARAQAERSASASASRAAVLDLLVYGRSPETVAEDVTLRQAMAGRVALLRFPSIMSSSPRALRCGFYHYADPQPASYRSVWADCEVTLVDGTFGTSASVPLRFRVSGVGSTLRVLDVQLPGGGSDYAPDVRRIFPGALADRVLAAESEGLPDQVARLLVDRDAPVPLPASG